jgi:hypothetical protein
MRSNLRSLQDSTIKAANVPVSVALALDGWAIWMDGGSVAKGYPSKSSGIESGGIHCSEDGEHEADNYLALATDAAVRSLNPVQIAAIGVLWLGNDPRGERTIPEIVIGALPIIYRVLVKKGCC